MLTKGIIVDRVGNDNHFLVRIPILENANDVENSVIEATLSYTAGIVESFKPEDVVIVGFENHSPDNPIIVGKLYLQGDVDEPRGFANLESLNVSKSVVLPEDTIIAGQSLKNLPNLFEILGNDKIVEFDGVINVTDAAHDYIPAYSIAPGSSGVYILRNPYGNVGIIAVRQAGSTSAQVSGCYESVLFQGTLTLSENFVIDGHYIRAFDGDVSVTYPSGSAKIVSANLPTSEGIYRLRVYSEVKGIMIVTSSQQSPTRAIFFYGFFDYQYFTSPDHTGQLLSEDFSFYANSSSLRVIANPTLESGETPAELARLQVGGNKYKLITTTDLDTKVDKVAGKGLSTNDFTDTYKGYVDSNTTKLSKISYDSTNDLYNVQCDVDISGDLGVDHIQSSNDLLLETSTGGDGVYIKSKSCPVYVSSGQNTSMAGLMTSTLTSNKDYELPNDAYESGASSLTLATREWTKSNVVRNQDNVVFILDFLQNINGKTLSAYTATETTISSYSCVQIKKDGAILTKEQAASYLKGMGGSEYVPTYDYDYPTNSYLIRASDGLILKPQWDATNGLVLYKMKNLADRASVVKYAGDVNIGSGSPFSGATAWVTSANLPNGNALLYNSQGQEYTLLYSYRPSDLQFGTILRWGYHDNYMYIARKDSNTYVSSDWEKISAGYADSAYRATYADNVDWSDISNRPTIYCYEFIIRANSAISNDNLIFKARGYSTTFYSGSTTIASVLSSWVGCFGTNEVTVSGALRSVYFNDVLIVTGVKIPSSTVSADTSMTVRYTPSFSGSSTTGNLDSTTTDVKTSHIISASVTRVQGISL